MSTRPIPTSGLGGFFAALNTQMRVIGALIMRELHTRYGRENIGYLWLIGEPMMLASVMASLHHSGHTPYGSDIKPLPFTILGYTTYIMFRGIVNRAEGTLESNAPLLYHRMVTVFDISLARVLLEATGVFLTYCILMALVVLLGLAEPPARPLYLLAAQGSMLWFSWANSMILIALTHDNTLVARLTHPYSYFMIPLSAAWFQMEWVPNPYRYYLSWIPLPHIFELARYGQFRSSNLDYFDGFYLWSVCTIMTWIGLVSLRMTRRRIHLH